MKQAAAVVIAMVSFALVGVPQLHIADDIKSIISFTLGVINAGLGAYLAQPVARALRGFQAPNPPKKS